MPVLAVSYISLTAAGESDLDAGVCPACGSRRLEHLQGYYETGVTGPNGEPETHWREAVQCQDCGELLEEL
jgi:hypothetical protein